jgi:hypothetical protein
MVIQRMKAIGPCFHHVGCGIEWNRDAKEFLGSIDTATEAVSIYQDPVLSKLIIHQFANTVIEDDSDEELLEVIFSAFGFVDWPVTEMCPFLLYVFLYLGQPLIYSMRCAAELASILAISDEWMRPTCVLHLIRVLDTKRTLELTERYFNVVMKEYIVRLAPRFIKYRCVTECLPDTIAWYVNYETDDSNEEEESIHGEDLTNFPAKIEVREQLFNTQVNTPVKTPVIEVIDIAASEDDVEENTPFIDIAESDDEDIQEQLLESDDATKKSNKDKVPTGVVPQSCVCGIQHCSDTITFWLQCDRCTRWFTVSSFCVGFTKTEAPNVGVWACPNCH